MASGRCNRQTATPRVLGRPRRRKMSFMRRMVVIAVGFVLMALLACGGPTKPRGTATITITGVSVENGGSATQGLGLDTTLTITASDELLQSSSNANPYV